MERTSIWREECRLAMSCIHFPLCFLWRQEVIVVIPQWENRGCISDMHFLASYFVTLILAIFLWQSESWGEELCLFPKQDRSLRGPWDGSGRAEVTGTSLHRWPGAALEPPGQKECRTQRHRWVQSLLSIDLYIASTILVKQSLLSIHWVWQLISFW